MMIRSLYLFTLSSLMAFWGQISLAAENTVVNIEVTGKSSKPGSKSLPVIMFSGEVVGKKTLVLEQRGLVFFTQVLETGPLRLSAVTPFLPHEKINIRISNELGEHQILEIYPTQEQTRTLVFNDGPAGNGIDKNSVSRTAHTISISNLIVPVDIEIPQLQQPVQPVQPQTAQKNDDDDEFDLSFINKGNKNISQSIVKSLNQVIPGRYSVELGVNNIYVSKIDVEFTRRQADSNPKACLTAQHIFLMGIKQDKLKPEGAAIFQTADLQKNSAGTKEPCLYIEEWVDNSSESYDKNELVLSLFVPQAFVKVNKNQSLPPGMLTQGENAGFINYNFNYYQNAFQGTQSSGQFLNLDAGLNMYGWQLRQTSYANAANNTPTTYKLGDFSANRTLIDWKSRLSMGAISSQSPVIGGVPVNGVKMYSEEGLLPDEERSYKPVVKGFARTNARVKIKQNGLGFFEQNVPPGPFEFSDLNPVSNIGDLQVTVSESDGTEQTFIVPYSNTLGKLNKGSFRYNVTVGTYRNDYLSTSTQTNPLVQSFVRYGLTDFFTPAIDSLLSSKYQSVGTQLNFGNILGSQSFNYKSSRLLNPQEITGYQVNANFALPRFGLMSLGSNLSYQSQSFTDANNGLNTAATGVMSTSQATKSLRNINSGLNLGSWGNLNFSASRQDAWTGKSLNNNINLGYSVNIKNINFSTSMSRSKNDFGANSSRTIDSIMFNVSMPLSVFNNPGSLSYNSSQSGNSQVSHNMNYTGNYSEDVTYALGYAKRGEEVNQSANLNLAHPAGYTSVGASSSSSGSTSASFSASGGLVLHKSGIIASQSLGETFGIIEVPGGSGVRAQGSKSTVNSRGFGVVPNLAPFAMNIVDLDLSKAPLDVELESSSQRVAPVNGAIVKLSYVSTIGRPLLVHFSGEKIPFGASVFDSNNNELGTLGPGNRGLVRVKSDKGQLKVNWGDGPDESCTSDYEIKPEQKALSSGYTLVELACQR